MSTWKGLFVTFFCCWVAIFNGFTQVLPGNQLSLDSVITLTNNMLNPQMIGKAKPRIDSLVSLTDDPKSRLPLLTKLKIKSLQGKYLLQSQKTDEWPDLYQWCGLHEPLCRSEDEYDLLVRLYNNAGIAFKRLGRLNDSEEAFLKATEILPKLKITDYNLSGSVYANAGNSLKQIGEFDRSIEYLQQSVGFFNQFVENGGGNNAIRRIADPKSKALDNLGLVYQALGDHRKAIEVFKQCIELKLQFYPRDIAHVYGNLVISLIEVGDYLEARQIIELTLSGYGTGIAKDHTWALAKLNLADVNFRMSRDTAGIFRELGILKKLFRKETPQILDVPIICDQIAANLLLLQKKHLAALEKWSEALSVLASENELFDPMELPLSVKTYNFNKLIELMNLNSKIFYDWGKQSQDPEILQKAENRYSFTLMLIDSLRNSLELQSSKLQVSRMQQSNYEQLIELQFTIFQLTADSTYLGRIFTTMEQSKSAGLWSKVKDLDFKNSRIDPEDLEFENAVRRNMADVEGKIIEAGAAQVVDQNRIRELQQENLQYIRQIDSLKSLFRTKYPDYYKAKFDRATISLDSVKVLLQPGQILIEYSIAYDFIYEFTVSKSGAMVSRLPVTQKSLEDIAFILNFMKGNVESLTSSARSRYCEAAYGLYDLLIKPSSRWMKSRNVLIIPDGSLSYIPFETLLEPGSNGSKQDYRKLPYLIRNHSISYGLTATFFFYKPTRVNKPTKRILAIAPGYDLSSPEISDYIRRAESGLPELQGTYKESKAIKRMLGGRLLSGKEATEARFKKLAPDYRILHLAMHTIPNSENSLNSSLVFTPGADRKEDGLLFGHEVYNLSLNSWLTVLSACETGAGQMASGEGILSFGRAFIVAGCPNLIMTMWTVDDRSSQEIMVGFYHNLQDGIGIADALQKSKISYLQNADQLHAHPHYWAGFIELGQNQVLEISNRKPGIVYLLLSIIATVLAIAYLQAKKNPRRSRDISKME